MTNTLLYQIQCINRHCVRTVEEYRVKKQSDTISKWHFCSKCIRSSEILSHECRKDNCTNVILFEWKRNGAFCSSQCKSRHHYYTRENEMKQCLVCWVMFEGNMGYAEKYCSDECRIIKNNNRNGIFISSQTLIVQLLQKGDSDMERISKYIKKDYRQTRDLIYKLRKKGHHITLSAYQGKYHYEGFIV